MREYAETLAKGFDYLRCDFYELDGEVYFSELTVYPLSGLGGSNPHLVQRYNANWDLRKSWVLTTQQHGWRRIYVNALRRWLEKEGVAHCEESSRV